MGLSESAVSTAARRSLEALERITKQDDPGAKRRRGSSTSDPHKLFQAWPHHKRRDHGNFAIVSNSSPRMPPAELFELYDTHSLLLFPSLHDSGGFVVLEALSHGLPVVCLDLGGPREIVTA